MSQSNGSISRALGFVIGRLNTSASLYRIAPCLNSLMKRGKLDNSEDIRLRMEELSEVLEMMVKVIDMWGCSRPVTLCMTK